MDMWASDGDVQHMGCRDEKMPESRLNLGYSSDLKTNLSSVSTRRRGEKMLKFKLSLVIRPI